VVTKEKKQITFGTFLLVKKKHVTGYCDPAICLKNNNQQIKRKIEFGMVMDPALQWSGVWLFAKATCKESNISITRY
jgi:hypothetical protein